MIVVDASLATKLILREPDSDLADKWYLDLTEDVIAPDLIVVEVAQAVVRRVNARQLTPETGREILRAWRTILEGSGFTLERTDLPTAFSATELAIILGHPVKDCVYLALAVDRGATLMTCDAKFAGRARSVYPAVALLADA